MNSFISLIQNAFAQTVTALAHNWPYLLASVVIAASLKAFVDTNKVAGFLTRWKGVGVVAATGAAVMTPFCSCGTTAVILGMMASTMPLAPIVAFMVASPLSSPEELFYSAGLFGWPFALFYFASSIALGLAGGGIAALLERRGWLRGQTRFDGTTKPGSRTEAACDCAENRLGGTPTFRKVEASRASRLMPSSKTSCACGAIPGTGAERRAGTRSSATLRKAKALGHAILDVSKKLLPLFAGFAFIGYVLNSLIPPSWMSALFGKGHAYSVPLAATVGLPLYVSSEASLPLVRALFDSGMSQGAIMAFLIAGSGTSVGAITGALAIARWKVVGLVVAVLWLGAMVAGYGFDAIVATGLAGI